MLRAALGLLATGAVSAFHLAAPVLRVPSSWRAAPFVFSAIIDGESETLKALRTDLDEAKAQVRLARAAGSDIQLINAQEVVDALWDRIDLQISLEYQSTTSNENADEALVAKVEDVVAKGLNVRGKRRRASPPVACSRDPATVSGSADVSSAAAEVAARLAEPAFSVPHVDHLHDWLPSVTSLPTPFHGGCISDMQTMQEDLCFVAPTDEGLFVDEQLVVLADPVVSAKSASIEGMTAYTAAGPREEVFFSAQEARAAIVTCGGLCPGLNTVVKELVNCLRSQYGVEDVCGVKHGYMGFYDEAAWTELGLEDVETIHRQGGSVLGSSRGGHDTAKICDAIEARGVNMVFTIGGDGTMRGSRLLAEEFIQRGSKVVVAHVPKTIDNDIPLVDSSFGFGTAVQEATRAIHAARDEAVAYPNGIGIVTLMGRHSGFIAAHATMAARGVDVCLVPEVEFELDGPDGLLRHLESRIAQQGHCVLVVAEGAGQHLLETADIGLDASGNKGLAEIGPYLKARIAAHFNELGDPASLKAIDPTYMVRATPATAADNILCLQLAHDAVHGAFAGYTGFLSGRVNGRGVYIPLDTAAGRRNIAPSGNFWQQLVFATGQPNW